MPTYERISYSVRNTFIEIPETNHGSFRRERSSPAVCSRHFIQTEEKPDVKATAGSTQETNSTDAASVRSESEVSTNVSSSDEVTLMIRNLPNRVKATRLVSAFQNAGLGEEYNYLYLPIDIRNGVNKGYCFINFVNRSSADKCIETFSGSQLAGTTSKKKLMVQAAYVQGMVANLEGMAASGPMVSSSSSRSVEPSMPWVRIDGQMEEVTVANALKHLGREEEYEDILRQTGQL